MAASELIKFGRPLREKYFPHVDPEVLLVNSGAFGLAPKVILDYAHEQTLKDYNWPDSYRKVDYREDLDINLKEVARILKTDYTNVVFGANVTTFINAVLRSVDLKEGDGVLVTNNTYPALVKALNFEVKKRSWEVITLDLDYPLSDKEVIEKYEQIYKERSNISLSLIDVISSKPGVLLPYEQLIKLSKQYNVLSLVDAAHGIGLINFNLNELQPDFFTTDLYKWYYTPKGTAVLYVHPSHHRTIHSLPISHFYVDSDTTLDSLAERTRFIDEFNYTGASLISIFNTVLKASEFIQEIGGLERIQEWNFNLAKQVGPAIANLWGTSYLENKEGTLVTSLVSVEYPVKPNVTINTADWEDPSVYKVIRLAIELDLIKNYKTVAPIFHHNGKVWIRFSAQVYSDLEDYIEAAKRIRQGADQFFDSSRYKKLVGTGKVDN